MFTAISPLSPSRHAGRFWQRIDSYAFAARAAVAPLVGAEFTKAAHAFPIAFTREADSFAPVAVLGLEPGRNLFVTADNRWVGAYIPARLRGYPFIQAQTEDGRTVLCVDEGSGLLSEPGQETAGSAPLFTEGGALSESVQAIAGFLAEVEKNRVMTQAAIGRLAAAGVIQPWSIPVTMGGAPRTITGLFTIDEAALRALPDPDFVGLRQHGALALAYVQLISREHVALLERLATAHAQNDDARQRRLAGSFVDEPTDDLRFDFGSIS